MHGKKCRIEIMFGLFFKSALHMDHLRGFCSLKMIHDKKIP